jgi:putative ABC transport system ATP-binding protein
MHAIRTEQLHHNYGSRKISFPDITCEAGDHTLLLGPSGCGKTTLLQLISGIRNSQAGDVWIDDTQLNKLSQAKRDQFRGRHIGMIYQTSHFVRSLSVLENLALAQRFAGETIDRGKLKGLLDKLNILDKANQKTYTLSQGEQQRVAIARALVNNPILILADEPTSALDDNNTNAVFDLLVSQADQVNATLIVVTHDNRLKSKFDKRIEL